jgi:hypothetical protein
MCYSVGHTTIHINNIINHQPSTINNNNSINTQHNPLNNDESLLKKGIGGRSSVFDQPSRRYATLIIVITILVIVFNLFAYNYEHLDVGSLVQYEEHHDDPELGEITNHDSVGLHHSRKLGHLTCEKYVKQTSPLLMISCIGTIFQIKTTWIHIKIFIFVPERRNFSCSSKIIYPWEDRLRSE